MNVKDAIGVIKQGLNLANQNGFKGYSLEDASVLNEAIKEIEKLIPKEPKVSEKKQDPELETNV
jgi:hypothetical protein